MRQPLMNAMMYATTNVVRFCTVMPIVSATAPRTAGASAERRDVSAPLVFSSLSNHATSM